MSILRKVFDRIRPAMIIHADAGEIVFRLGQVEIRQQPLIRIADDGKVIEFGKAAIAAEGGRLVHLFAVDSGNDDQEALRAFCRYHLLLATSTSISLRPRVTILEPAIRKAFGAHASAALRKVLRADGISTDIAAAT